MAMDLAMDSGSVRARVKAMGSVKDLAMAKEMETGWATGTATGTDLGKG